MRTYPVVRSRKAKSTGRIETQDCIHKSVATKAGVGVGLDPDDRLWLISVDTDLPVRVELTITNSE